MTTEYIPSQIAFTEYIPHDRGVLRSKYGLIVDLLSRNHPRYGLLGSKTEIKEFDMELKDGTIIAYIGFWHIGADKQLGTDVFFPQILVGFKKRHEYEQTFRNIARSRFSYQKHDRFPGGGFHVFKPLLAEFMKRYEVDNAFAFISTGDKELIKLLEEYHFKKVYLIYNNNFYRTERAAEAYDDSIWILTRNIGYDTVFNPKIEPHFDQVFERFFSANTTLVEQGDKKWREFQERV